MGISYPNGSISLYPPSGTLSNPPGSISTGEAYAPESEALFATMTPEPNTAQKNAINDFMVNGWLPIWAKMDGIYVLHSYGSQPSLLNWKNPAETAATVSSPVFFPYSRWQGNGVSAYITIPTVASQYTRNNCHVGLSQPVLGTGIGPVVGGAIGGWVTRRFLYSLGVDRIISVNATGSNTIATPSAGAYSVLSRAVSTGFQVYDNGALTASPVQDSEAITGLQFRLLNSLTNYGAGGISVFHFGASLTAGEISTLTSAFSAYIAAMV